jgi:hypothetical protein
MMRSRRLQTRIDRFALKRKDAEDAFVNPAERLTPREAF